MLLLHMRFPLVYHSFLCQDLGSLVAGPMGSCVQTGACTQNGAAQYRCGVPAYLLAAQPAAAINFTVKMLLGRYQSSHCCQQYW